MADSKRRGRSDDDEFEDAELDEFDDQDELDDDDALDEDDDLDEDEDDEFEDEFDEDEDEEEAASTAGRSRTAARTKAAASTRSRTVTRPKTKAGAQRKKKDDVGPGIIGRLIRFVREVVAELQKVNWPTRKELMTYTTVVVVFVAIMMTLVALLDLGFARAMFAVFGGTKTPATGTGQ